MHRFLITGGLGFLGQHLIKCILERYPQCHVTVLARSDRARLFKETSDKRVTVIHADILDPIMDHFQDIDCVFHVAAMISFWYKDRQSMNKINVEGTRKIVGLCLKHHVRRMVHISSTATIKGSNKHESPADEQSDYDWKGKSRYDYGLSKYYAEKEVEKGIKKGLEAVIINPCSILGYGDTKFFPLIETVKKQIPVCISGGAHLIDARDLAKGIISAYEKGRCGERYLLAGKFHTQMEILTTTAKILDLKPPKFSIPGNLLIPLLPILALSDRLSANPPELTRTMLENNLAPSFYSYHKAQQELGFEPCHTLKESMEEVIRFYREKIK